MLAGHAGPAVGVVLRNLGRIAGAMIKVHSGYLMAAMNHISPAPTGRPMKAQGNALGIASNIFLALKGRNPMPRRTRRRRCRGGPKVSDGAKAPSCQARFFFAPWPNLVSLRRSSVGV